MDAETDATLTSILEQLEGLAARLTDAEAAIAHLADRLDGAGEREDYLLGRLRQDMNGLAYDLRRVAEESTSWQR